MRKARSRMVAAAVIVVAVGGAFAAGVLVGRGDADSTQTTAGERRAAPTSTVERSPSTAPPSSEASESAPVDTTLPELATPTSEPAATAVPTASTVTAASTSSTVAAVPVEDSEPAALIDAAALSADAQFFESFSEERGFTERFEHGWSGLDPATFGDGVAHVSEWHGDHDETCAGPTSSRTVQVDDKSQIFWWCAPGGEPAKGHVMSGVNTSGYNIAWFAPVDWFTDVTMVCWDQNLTDLGGGKWTQIVIASRADVEESGGDLGFVGPGFRDLNGPTTGIVPVVGNGSVGATSRDGWFTFWHEDVNEEATKIYGGLGLADKAARYQHCMEDLGNGTIRLTQQRDGGLESTISPGSFPDGEVRVVFQDDNYDADKHGGTSTPEDPRYTWHWDNILIV